MRSTAYRPHQTGHFLTGMAWLAIASFVAGFGGFLIFGLNSVG